MYPSRRTAALLAVSLLALAVFVLYPRHVLHDRGEPPSVSIPTPPPHPSPSPTTPHAAQPVVSLSASADASGTAARTITCRRAGEEGSIVLHLLPEPLRPTPGYPRVNTSLPMYWKVYAFPHPNITDFMQPPATPLPRPPPACIASPCDVTHPKCFYNGVWAPRVNTKMRGGRGGESEAWWRPAQCALPPLQPSPAERHGGLEKSTAERYSKCLRGRTILIVGNSVSRQWMFSALRLFTGRLVVRQKQKDQCGIHCGMYLPGPVHMVYLHALALWGEKPHFTKDGFFHGHALAGSFLGLRPDVVVYGLGHQDAFGTHDFLPSVHKLACYLTHLAGAGLSVFVRTALPLRKFFVTGVFSDPKFIVSINHRLERINAAIRDVFRGTNVTVLDEAVLAENGLGEGVVDAVYEDHIHSPSVATEMLRAFLDGLCPAQA
eukprot:Sspe_Gene.59962::Locus_32991_Transcript_2_2_Confidence_0.500_Length_1401::g.59962::m.59962